MGDLFIYGINKGITFGDEGGVIIRKVERIRKDVKRVKGGIWVCGVFIYF
jgi:hypothetical protein